MVSIQASYLTRDFLLKYEYNGYRKLNWYWNLLDTDSNSSCKIGLYKKPQNIK